MHTHRERRRRNRIWRCCKLRLLVWSLHLPHPPSRGLPLPTSTRWPKWIWVFWHPPLSFWEAESSDSFWTSKRHYPKDECQPFSIHSEPVHHHISNAGFSGTNKKETEISGGLSKPYVCKMPSWPLCQQLTYRKQKTEGLGLVSCENELLGS